MNPLVKASLTIVAVAAIVYALLPPAPNQDDGQQPFTVDLAVPGASSEGRQAPFVSSPEKKPPRADDRTAPTAEAQPTMEAPGEPGHQADLSIGAAPDEAATAGEAAPEAPEPAAELTANESTAGAGEQTEPAAELTTNESTAGAGEQTEPAEADGLAEHIAAEDETPEPTAETEDQVAVQDAAASPEDGIWIEREIESGDTLAAIFQDFGLSSTLLAELVDSGSTAKSLAMIRPGQKLSFHLDPQGELQELLHERSSIATLRISRNDEGDGFEAEIHEKPVEARTQTASGVIDSSLFGDGQNAGLSDKVIMALAELFNWDIDFARELRQGDRFAVIYEADYVDGEKYRDSDILAAEFVNNGKSYRAIRFQDPDGLIEYYAPDGSAKKKAFIKTPVKFSRISSRFTNKRWHPVLKRWRSHKGVDYAAPTGTPIRAAGKGKVSFVGRQQGYGKVIYLQHGDRYTTVYGHLSGFAKGLDKGDSVKQGDVIGYVGQTGLATGPHLHYEFRVNGKHVDPLSHDLPTAMPLPSEYMAAFKKHAEPLVEQLNLLAAPQVAETR